MKNKLNNLPFNNLGYPVLLNLDYGASFGSGFRLKYKDLNFIVTAGHVLFDEDKNLRCKNITLTCQDIQNRKLTSVTFEIDTTKAIPVYHKKADIAVVMIGRNINLTKKTIPLKDEKSKFIQPAVLIGIDGVFDHNTGTPKHLVSVGQEATRLFDQICIGNDMYIIGYPISLGIKESKQIDFSKPLLRKGIVAGLNYDQRTIILDCPAYFGNSGGPVIEYGEDGFYRIIGVVCQYVPFVNEWYNLREKYSNKEYMNSGYSIAVPMDYVYELIDEKYHDEIIKKPSEFSDEVREAIAKVKGYFNIE
jgi:hypothetical protein